ncbi:unnamed protein product [Phytophthora lilii]|uniref:Unnamed protein product n=1 Tax=Phytophthora lilii TaxID=2077276 RepID=A0A9W6TFQ5_9STRA|nr:unnamed protein product [Phytophthora lilii]
MAGVLDQPSRLVTTIRSADSPPSEKPLVFHLNSKSYARWYYEWESGANKAQRLMKHVLKAYIVERCAVDEDNNVIAATSSDAHKQLYRVVHVVTSPEFTVVSYRRAPSEQYHTLGEHNVSPYAEMYHRGVSPVGSYDGAPSHPRLSAGRKEQLRLPTDVGPLYNHQVKRQKMPTPPVRRLGLEGVPDLLEDKLRWEYKNSSTVSVTRNLALVYSFVRWAPLSVYASFVDELVHLTNESLLESLAGAAQEASRLNCFSKLLLNQAKADGETAVASSFVHGKRTIGGAPATLPQDLDTLLRVLADATLWLFSTDTRRWMKAFFCQYAGLVLDKRALRECFVLFVQELQTRLDTHVFAHTPLLNLANAAEEIIATVYSYEYFHARRPRLRKILSGQSFAGWGAFVAQMRETYISLTSFPGVPRNLSSNRSGLNFERAHIPQNSVENGWNAEWVLDVDEAAWKPNEESIDVDVTNISSFGNIDDDVGAVSLFTLFETISNMMRIEVGINVQARTLHIRSTQGVAGPLDCMRLVLDGKDRLFSQFPNGMASSAEPGAHGDYIGEMQVERPGRLVVYLQIFNWSVHKNGPSYHARMRIECWNNRRLCVSGDILASTAPTPFSPEEALYLGEMSLRNKREVISKSYGQQLRKNIGPSASALAAPWKELGRFRLSYLKA